MRLSLSTRSQRDEEEREFRDLFAAMSPEQRRGAYRLATRLLSRRARPRMDVLMDLILDADGAPSWDEIVSRQRPEYESLQGYIDRTIGEKALRRHERRPWPDRRI